MGLRTYRSKRDFRRTPEPIDPAGLPGARQSPLPKEIRPQLATLVSEVPEGEQWLHEIKFDGYRAICRIENGSVRFLTRTGQDWTVKFGNLPKAAAELPVTSALLDGEIVVLLPDGSSSFQELQNALGKNTEPLVYYAFDLIYLNGYSISGGTPGMEMIAPFEVSTINPGAVPLGFSMGIAPSGI